MAYRMDFGRRTQVVGCAAGCPNPRNAAESRPSISPRRPSRVGEGGTAAALGLRGMVVVHVHGAALSCPVDRTEDVRQVTEAVGRRRA